MDHKNVTSDTLIIAFSPQRENSNAVFESEKLETLNKLVKAVANMTINDVEYDLSAETASDAQIEFVSNPDGITHINNGINHKNLLSSKMIRIQHEEVSVFSPPKFSLILYWRHRLSSLLRCKK